MEFNIDLNLDDDEDSMSEIDLSTYKTNDGLANLNARRLHAPQNERKSPQVDYSAVLNNADVTANKENARRIPGPLGLLPDVDPFKVSDAVLQSLSTRSPADSGVVSEGSPFEHPPGYVAEPAYYDNVIIIDDQPLLGAAAAQELDIMFQANHWLSLLEFMNVQPFGLNLLGWSLARIAHGPVLDDAKVPDKVLAIVRSLVHVQDDAKLTLKDPTGEMSATVHRRVLEQCGSQLDIGSCIAIQSPSILYGKADRSRYLCITPANVIRILPLHYTRKSEKIAHFTSSWSTSLSYDPVALLYACSK